MESAIKQRFTPEILPEAMRRFDIPADKIEVLDGFESFIYAFERHGRPYILRIGHTLHRSQVHIFGEIDWLAYLAGVGVSVAQPVRSQSGAWVEVIDDGQEGYFLAVAFHRAPGQKPWEAGWTPARYEAYGRLLGEIHRHTKSYALPEPSWRRPEWDDPEMCFTDLYLPPTEGIAHQKYGELMAYLRTLPRAADNYGLIHQDAHESNFLVDGDGHITLFDFDDCAYSWFINELAIVLFYIVMDKPDHEAFTRTFMPHFWRGYTQANPLDPMWLAEIPHFLKLRELDLYAVIHRDFDVTNIDHPWCARFMLGRKERIENATPFIDLDFTQFDITSQE